MPVHMLLYMQEGVRTGELEVKRECGGTFSDAPWFLISRNVFFSSNWVIFFFPCGSQLLKSRVYAVLELMRHISLLDLVKWKTSESQSCVCHLKTASFHFLYCFIQVFAFGAACDGDCHLNRSPGALDFLGFILHGDGGLILAVNSLKISSVSISSLKRP